MVTRVITRVSNTATSVSSSLNRHVACRWWESRVPRWFGWMMVCLGLCELVWDWHTLGPRLKYMDGHTHCNHAGGSWAAGGAAEEVGFMIGGHGMSGCSQYGFAVVDSTGGRLRLLYYEERSAGADAFEQILACVAASGISSCAHLASVWLDSPLDAAATTAEGF